MNLRYLRQFLAVLETGNMHRAAEKLRISQPALSKTIRSLETEIGVKLFDRSVDGMSPTIFGQMLGEHAKSLEAGVRLAIEDMNALKGVQTGSLSIGASPSVMRALMPEVSRRMMMNYPGLAVRLVEGMREAWLRDLYQGTLDVVVGTPPQPITEALIETRVLFGDSVAILCHKDHPLHRRPNLHLDQLQDVDWIMPPASEQYIRERWRDMFLRSGLLVPTPKIESNSGTYLHEMVAGCRLVTYLPKLLFFKELRSGVVSELNVPDTRIERKICLMNRRRRTPPPGLAAFLQTMLEVCESMGLSEDAAV